MTMTRNAMLVYPYIKSGVMSHGKAAEMLGLHKIDLITLYGKLGLPYFDESRTKALAQNKKHDTLCV